ncbi:hypothetical protein BGZ83_009019 [Gryganskiella cystojenkinii]|nr:hypothetical protein BGZ83_009019 [Gryganskiella cystojenkinii]
MAVASRVGEYDSQYLSPAETSRCICVSKRWTTIWSPILWQCISVLSKRRCALFQHALKASTFLRNCFFMQTFRAAFGLAFGNLLLAADCQQLQALELLFNVLPSNETSADLLAVASSLSSGTLSASSIFPYQSPSDVVLALLNKNTNMKELSIIGDFEYIVGPSQEAATSAVTTTNILSYIQSDHLEFLSIEFMRNRNSEFNEPWVTATTHLPNLRRLEVLNITGSETSLLDLVFRCPSLVSLKVHRDIRFNSRIKGELIWDSSKALQYIGLTLKALRELVWEVDDVDELCMDMLSKIFLINPGQMTKIKSLLEAAASIEVLTLDGVAIVSGDEIQEFMQRATNLRVFKIMTLSRPYDKEVDRPLFHWDLYNPKGNNYDKRPWACEQTLQRLAVVIQVGEEARSDIGVNPKPVMTEAEKNALKRVYSQLSKLTKLRELVLSGQLINRVRDLDKMHTECLALSLESGLDMLHDMKEMEVLDVRNCAHRIGVRELEWIHEHWPKLKTIKGLTESRSWADREAEKEMAKVKQWKAEHPGGIGSSFD